MIVIPIENVQYDCIMCLIDQAYIHKKRFIIMLHNIIYSVIHANKIWHIYVISFHHKNKIESSLCYAPRNRVVKRVTNIKQHTMYRSLSYILSFYI